MNFKLLIVYIISIVALGLADPITDPTIDSTKVTDLTTDPTEGTTEGATDPTIVTDPTTDSKIVTGSTTDSTIVTDPTTDPSIVTDPTTDHTIVTDPTIDSTIVTDSKTDSTIVTDPETGSTTITDRTTDPVSDSTTETSTTAEPTTPPPPTFADIINTCTQNLLGVNCMVQNVYNIEDVTENFRYEIGLCSSKVRKESASVLDKVKNLENYASKIKQANDKTCTNANYNPKTDANKIPSAKCVKNITNNMNKLNESVETTINKVNKYFDKSTNGCASMALLKFKLNLNNFRSIVIACGKLAANV